ncbi:DUF6238 family protein [Kitasatospora sp. YST-16]|uniref:DUF6238 family protein n=1 Tax=Kitasatospora sp. YST-16 TaxID=2998080 RepID=UPI00228494AE|nr:DUF6238 family protein [Kitasatospora sp. YST-16]WAL74624.1 DUF6238 family protein [Kitasatospora sp. YST-16]
MHHPPADSARLLRFASTAVDVHHHTSLPDQLPASRTELDALHAHCTALFRLVDTHTATTRPHQPAEADQLHAARVRLWQTADALHAAYHRAPRGDDRAPTREACALRLPEGAPDLGICQRHTLVSVRMRRVCTPAELRGTPTSSRA